MWLNIMSFVLASMLVVTGLAKRFALWLIVKFGKNASTIFISFLIINLVLSAFISATTAKAAILLPIFMVIAAIYGAKTGEKRNNFGRSIVLQNLLYINIGAGAFVTGSGANLLAAAHNWWCNWRKHFLFRLDDGNVSCNGFFNVYRISFSDESFLSTITGRTFTSN